MSADEDTELRDLVAQALEAKGVLGKIRAQLRASVFLALEEQEAVQNKTPLLNNELRKFFGSKDGLLVGALIRDFLRHFNLDYTLCVFDPEAEWHGDEKAQYDARDELAAQLNIKESNETRSRPLLVEVLKRSLKLDNGSTGKPTSEVKKSETTKSDVSPVHTPVTKAKSPSFERQSSDDISLGDDLLPDSKIQRPKSATRASGIPVRSSDAKTKPAAAAASSATQPHTDNNKTTTASSAKPAANEKSELTSLSGLPPLGGGTKPQPTEKLKFYDDVEYDEDFEDDGNDFERSNVSPDVGQTPRSARSDRSGKGGKKSRNTDDDEDEEVEEDISEDDVITSDRTVSPSESHAQGDYSEDVNPLTTPRR